MGRKRTGDVDHNTRVKRIAVCSWSVLYKAGIQISQRHSKLCFKANRIHTAYSSSIHNCLALNQDVWWSYVLSLLPKPATHFTDNMPIAPPPPTRAEVKVHTTTSSRRTSTASRAISEHCVPCARADTYILQAAEDEANAKLQTVAAAAILLYLCTLLLHPSVARSHHPGYGGLTF